MTLTALPQHMDDEVYESFKSDAGENLAKMFPKDRAKTYIQNRKAMHLAFLNALIASGKARVRTEVRRDAFGERHNMNCLIIDLE